MSEIETRRTEHPGSRLAPHMLFFPAAALYAAVVLSLSVLAMTRVGAGPASLATAFGHAHELLVGYALAVVAGNQLPPMSIARAVVLFGLWARHGSRSSRCRAMSRSRWIWPSQQASRCM